MPCNGTQCNINSTATEGLNVGGTGATTFDHMSRINARTLWIQNLVDNIDGYLSGLIDLHLCTLTKFSIKYSINVIFTSILLYHNAGPSK